MKKILKFLTSRVFIFAVLILCQAAVLVLGIHYLHGFRAIDLIMRLLSFAVVIYILSRSDNPMYKIAWIIPVLLLPVFGGLFYLIFGKRNITRAVRRHMKNVYMNTRNMLEKLEDTVLDELKNEDGVAYKQAYYIYNKALAPVYKNTYSEFLTPGEEKLRSLTAELKKAQHYIFLEYFIIEDGKMWRAVLDILKQKVREGVTIKLIYDDLGSIATLDTSFPAEMKKLGIEIRVFNPFRPSLDVIMNYRDHRKICIIDGNVGYTGGINLADEYINAYVKHGHWKDSAILLKGDAVWNLTIMFLQLWEDRDSCQTIDYLQYKPTVSYPEYDGYVQPFGDSPFDQDLIGEMTYMNIIHNALHYVYISTPYLILDNEMMTALTTAAQSGIDVRIVTPHIADKWFVHSVTRSNYLRLIKSGVKIYEYTPGFIHAKTIVCDDKYAIVGTTNFDFRSFYMHFECGVFLYKTCAVQQVKDDYEQILKVSEKVSRRELEQTNPFVKLIRMILGMFSPLM